VYIPPEYPELARRARLGGVVILEATIDRDGQVKDVNILRGLGLGLDEAAVKAVEQWMYTPTFYNGRPVEVLLTVTVQFQLQ
jgi:protein TonB